MALSFQNAELMELMRDFNILTGMRLVLFDENYNELLSYPDADAMFCSCMRAYPAFDGKCRMSDRTAFEQCRKTRALHIYRCHAGFMEATAPILEGGRIIGYLMFGQITDNPDRKALEEQIGAICQAYGMAESVRREMSRIRYRSEEQIRAAAKILDACTGYVRLREMVQPSGRQLIDAIGQYIDDHLSEEITVARLCAEFFISRTRLYELMRPHIDGGIAAFVRTRRLDKAKTLIRTTKMSIPEIADAVGFSDYNYFLRVFRQRFGISPRKLASERAED
ncbi:MAG: helix-turn-helix domain-containing protein [Ruminococcaceae bacterium]|nr:helix-turn-helix domain-containing protein [Oscillospiraceae bacterium]